MKREFQKGDKVKIRNTDDNKTFIFNHYSCWDSICFIITDSGIQPIEADKLYLDRTEIINQLLEE